MFPYPIDNARSVRQRNPAHTCPYLIDHHTVTEARARGWDELENGNLLKTAEAAGFEVLVTTDRNLRYQQNLTGRKLAIVVLGKGRWTVIKPHIVKIVAAVNSATQGSYTEVEFLFSDSDFCSLRPADNSANSWPLSPTISA